MRRKVLQDHANTLCQMFVGWRMAEDGGKLAAMGRGKFVVDILQGTATGENGVIELWIAGELNAWFRRRLREHHVEEASILEAVLEIVVDSSPVPNKRARGTTFNWDIRSRIRTEDAQYEGHLNEAHTWMGIG